MINMIGAQAKAMLLRKFFETHLTTMNEIIGPKVLIVDDDVNNIRRLRDVLEPEGYRILIASDGGTALKIAERSLPDIILLDIVMPLMNGYEVCQRLKEKEATGRIPVIFVTVKDDNVSLVKAFQVGGVDYIPKPFEKEEVLIRVENHLKISFLTLELLQKNKELQQEISRREEAENAFQKADEQLSIISQQEASRWGIESFIGKSKTIANILDEVRQLQKSSATSVLITGESGTGKELIARAIHFGSDRSKGPFIVLNCTAIPGELAESSLFGHARGAFSGAIAYHKGYFEQADGGTLFLDEIGDMPLALQPKLLRVIEDGLITPLGDTHEKHVDVRILAATNQDLQKKIAGGTFRSDLYFRLEHFRVTVPPLRERKEDIPLLVEHFLNMISGISKPTISQEVMSALENYQFPGNVRELKNIMERALIKSRGSMIRLEHLQFIHTDIQPKSDEHNSTDETKILTYIRQHGSINNAECRELLLVDRRRAAYLLEKMHHQGLLVQRSSRRWAQYYIPI